jgi:hypothetical protein
MNVLLEAVGVYPGKESSNKVAKGRGPDGHLGRRLIVKREGKREKKGK